MYRGFMVSVQWTSFDLTIFTFEPDQVDYVGAAVERIDRNVTIVDFRLVKVE